MASIKHRMIIETTASKLFNAITTEKGLSAWWTKASTNGEVNSVASFYFGPNGEHEVKMNVVKIVSNSHVVWQCSDGPWVMTEQFSFTIEPDPRGVALTFENSGWPAQDDFYAHCNAKWGFFLAVSLKTYLETGTGQPHPMDPNI